jgi:hypothetical protein
LPSHVRVGFRHWLPARRRSEACSSLCAARQLRVAFGSAIVRRLCFVLGSTKWSSYARVAFGFVGIEASHSISRWSAYRTRSVPASKSTSPHLNPRASPCRSPRDTATVNSPSNRSPLIDSRKRRASTVVSGCTSLPTTRGGFTRAAAFRKQDSRRDECERTERNSKVLTRSTCEADLHYTEFPVARAEGGNSDEK